MSVTNVDRLTSRLACYLVTDPAVESVERLVEIVGRAIEGGVTTVQLRSKGWLDRQALDAARRLRIVCSEQDVMFLVNDRIDIALASGADGVHLGVDDLPVEAARSILGPDAIIGYSPETEEDRERAVRDGASYLGVGPVFGTTTKADAGPALGLPAFRQVVRSVDIPVIGIGGIDRSNARSVRAAGAVGVAVVSSVFFADHPATAAREIVEAMR
ncbi:MAG: thiamine phosphate synthase [Thermomicrobiales bacterium]